MRFSQVVGGITAALLVSGVPAAKIPKRQDPPPTSSSVASTSAPPASTELPVPPPGSTEAPVPPPPSETPAPPPPSETPAPPPPSETPAPPVPTETPVPPPPAPTSSTEAPAPPPVPTSSTEAPPPAPPAPVETCNAHLLVDDFTQWETGENSLAGATSDDQTMNSTSIDGGILTFTPNNIDVSYIYEQFTCLDGTAQGYDSLSFNIKGPEAASVSIELQTVTDCASEEYQSFYYTLDGLSGSLQTINIPLNSWVDANLDGIVGVLWYGFSAGLTGTDNEWQLDNVQFLCADVAPPEDPEPPVVTTTSKPADPGSTDECSNLLIDDWVSQSRLTFLYYNALLKSSSDDGTMKSIVVKNNRVTFTPTDTDSYFYTQLGCIDAEAYGGVSLRISAPAGTTFDVQLSSTRGTCGTERTSDVVLSTRQLGWTFDGTEQLYSIPFSKFDGLDLSKFEMVYISNLRKAVTFGPMSLYCGEEVVEYIPPSVVEPSGPSETVPAPVGKATNLVIDTFSNKDTNALKQWHGADEGMTLTFRKNTMTLKTNDSDLMWVTQVADTCRDLSEFDGSYLHIAYTGSKLFTVSLQQHNEKCNNNIYPYPETWDSLEAQRYATDTDIYIPLDHFNVNRSRAIGFAFKGFYSTESTVFSKIEIVNEVPEDFTVPEKLPSGTFVFSCKRPNSFAFAIDDGDPVFAQQVMKTIDDAGITVTFFTVGAPLRDPTTNLSAIYNEMASKGHQIALHSYTHPPLEGLPDEASIDWEYSNDIEAVKETFNGLTPKYFRPPFGTEGARMRQRLAALIEDPYIVQWSVDVEDWLWAESDTPEKQLEAFKRDVKAGGDIVVMHYLYNSTVSYLKEFIEIAKATGKQLMRVDQCMMDPNAPPLPGEGEDPVEEDPEEPEEPEDPDDEE
ncbi:carbohydrate esterase family 4 protein [Annulohypoxylon moriforme]|nr:carbohydrate esterase family 4 protein [Annulohypoxylon moriforme]